VLKAKKGARIDKMALKKVLMKTSYDKENLLAKVNLHRTYYYKKLIVPED